MKWVIYYKFLDHIKAKSFHISLSLIAIIFFICLMLSGLTYFSPYETLIDLLIGFGGLFMVVHAIVTGVNFFRDEFDKQQILILTLRSISKSKFFWGKIISYISVMLLNVLIFLVTSFFVTLFFDGSILIDILIAFHFIFLEAFVVFLGTMCFSFFMSKGMTSFTSLCLYLFGCLYPQTQKLADHYKSTEMDYILSISQWLIPDFSRISYKNFVGRAIIDQASYIGANSIYALSFIILFLWLNYKFMLNKQIG